MNKRFKYGLIHHLLNLGLTDELSPLNTVRYKVINIINYIVFIAASLLLVYSIYVLDFHFIVVNSTLLLLTLLNIYFCKKSKHNIAINLTAIYLLLLVIDLCRSDLFISGVIYLSILPIAFTLLYPEPLGKHLYYFACTCIFTYFSYILKINGTIIFTYYIVTFGFYIAFLKFFNLAEQKQQELEDAIATLETKNAELQQYNHITSHDLQEPLGTISSFSNILTSKYSHTLDEIGRTSLQHIQNASNRMSALIKGLLEYSLIGNSGVHEPIIIAELIKNIKGLLKSTMAATNTKIIVDDIPLTFGHKIEIQTLLQHLILNAIRFRQVDIPPVIRISVKEKKGFWQFAVKDNGIGIEKIHLVKIFDIFQRLHTREEYAGNGIGLSHCKKIAQLHGGTIWAESIPNHGSTFYFTIQRKMILKASGRMKVYL